MEKYFLADVGLRYALMGHRAGDIGQILENVVYLELRRRGYQVFVGAQAGKEVDFIAVRQEERMYVQVAYLLASPETVEREFSVLSAIADHYPKWVYSMDTVPIGGREGIQWRNVIDFLLGR
jgi:predicted AAA+ superfamily ATPase